MEIKIQNISAAIQNTINQYETNSDNPKNAGIPSGFNSLDEITYGFHKSELIILGSQPGIGKTSLAHSMIKNICIEAGTPTGFISLESNESIICKRLISAIGRVNYQRLTSGELRPCDLTSITEATDKISRAPLFLNSVNEINSSSIIEAAQLMASKEAVQIIFIDYIDLLESEFSEILRRLKVLAVELNIPIIALTQTVNEEHIMMEIPHADTIMILERSEDIINFKGNPKESIVTYLSIVKHRQGVIGGKSPLVFIPHYTLFEDYFLKV